MTKDINLSQTQRGKSTHKYDNIHKRHKHKNSRYHKCFQNYYHAYQYLKPNPTYIPHIKTSVNHWQLRDLLQYDSALNLIYYTKSDSIYSYDLNTNTISNHCKLNYYPRCFNHSDNGILVSGGLLNSSSKLFSMNIENLSVTSPTSISNSPRKITKGLFSFHNSNLNISKSVRLGEMINNGVTIYPSSSNSYKSYVCNNDSYLYGVDIHNNDSIKIMNKFNLEINTCLNNVIQNPRSDKILTITGDSTSIFLVDPTSPNPNIKTIKSGHESGFGISYHNNGYLFSTVFQDGTCLLYDLRNMSHNKPLIDIKSTRQGHQSGAFRVCKFSPQNDMNDLLIISEHVGRVHLIDLRNLNYDNVDDHQVLVVPYALEQFGEFKNNVMGNPPHHSIDGESDNDKRNLIDIYENVKSKSSISRRKSSSSSYYSTSPNSNSNSNSPVKKSYQPSNSSSSPFSFPSPLVYDYDYLTNVNPKLFKDFIYVPPPPPLPADSVKNQSNYDSQSVFINPNWNPNNNNNDYSQPPPSQQRSSFSESEGNNDSKLHPRNIPYIDYDDDDDLDDEDNYGDEEDEDEEYYGSHTDGEEEEYNTLYNSDHQFQYPNSIPTQASTSMDSYANYSSVNSTNNCDDSFQQSINHIHGEMELSGIEFCNSQSNKNSKILIGCQDAGIVMWDINNSARRSFGSFDYV
ncbi:hypothetical protein DFJ63DRAFT_314153 [Scheffersomyces coipomensis]|uniref:uncharacterized protein n=1 Tax=Scheffersomyces coipomensis TaxID=1788519 RepID=UPI00315D6530